MRLIIKYSLLKITKQSKKILELNNIEIDDYCGYYFIDTYEVNNNTIKYNLFIECHAYKGSLVEEKIVRNNFLKDKIEIYKDKVLYKENIFAGSYFNLFEKMVNNNVLDLYVINHNWENQSSIIFFYNELMSFLRQNNEQIEVSLTLEYKNKKFYDSKFKYIEGVSNGR